MQIHIMVCLFLILTTFKDFQIYFITSLQPNLFTQKSQPSQLGLQNTLTASLQRVKTLQMSVYGYGTKQSDGEAPIMLELWGMWCIPLLPSLPGLLLPGVIATDRGPSMGQVELNCVLMLKQIV